MAINNEEGGIIAIVLPRNMPKRAREYIRKVLRPNIHIGIHYNQIYSEYSPPGLLNILAEEKYYK